MKYVYKIIAALGALATIPMLLFSKIFSYVFSSSALETLFYLGQLFNKSFGSEVLEQTGGKTPTGIADSTSLYELVNLFKSFGNLAADNGSNEELQKLLMPAIIFLILLALIVICAIVTAILAIVSKNNRKVVYSSIVGIALCAMSHVAFDSVVSPLIDGTLSTANIFNSTWATFIANVESISLSSSFWFVPAIFLIIIVWTVLYNATLPEKEKAERKLMLGEADE